MFNFLRRRDEGILGRLFLSDIGKGYEKITNVSWGDGFQKTVKAVSVVSATVYVCANILHNLGGARD